MLEPRTSDWEGLAMRVNALRAMEVAFRQNAPAAIPTIRRISRSLKLLEGAYFYPEILSIANTLIETPDANMGAALAKSLPRLGALTANPHAKNHRVLVVEDDRLTTQVLQRHLGALHQQVISCGTLAEAEKALADGNISLVLLDLQLPDGDGRELLLKLREQPSTAAMPVFVVSANPGTQVQTECFALGADAFFQKPFDPITISTAVAARLQRSNDLAIRSSIDPLTGLPNRATFANAFNRSALLASRSGKALTVALLDVDRFKAVNDMYGHAMGDRVLRRLASVVSKSLRATDMLARWGGEEFAMYFPDTDIDDARLALHKALQAFRSERFTTREGQSFKVTFSVGMVRAKPGMRAERAVVQADRVLYLAKASGRDQILTERDKVSLKKNVLLVEDDDFTAEVIKRHLKRDGFKVIHAKKEKAAVDALNSSVSLVTLDVKIPGTDGFKLLQRFRKVPSLRQTPIVMLTAAGKQEDILRGFQLGADDYIVKPFSPREFLARVHRLLEKQ